MEYKVRNAAFDFDMDSAKALSQIQERELLTPKLQIFQAGFELACTWTVVESANHRPRPLEPT